MFSRSGHDIPEQSRSIAAVSLGGGGTVQGPIVACLPDGRVTLQTPQGCVTGWPVVPETPGAGGIVAAFFGR